MASAEKSLLINPNQSLQRYYGSFESRVGYRLVLGGTRHFGYYYTDTYNPFPISRALRSMEDHLFEILNLERGSIVLDAGCGVGDVAIRMAQKGLRVNCIDVVDRHIVKANRKIKKGGWEHAIKVQRMDYHHLDAIEENSLDGAYTMETLVHATDAGAVLREFYRVLKPGGRMVSFEYDHPTLSSAPSGLRNSWKDINNFAAMPAFDSFEDGVLENVFERAGFVDIVTEDLTTNITPMLRFFYVLAFLPYIFVKLFGLEAYFINTVAGVEGYRSIQYSRYIAISATKPSESSKLSETKV